MGETQRSAMYGRPQRFHNKSGFDQISSLSCELEEKIGDAINKISQVEVPSNERERMEEEVNLLKEKALKWITPISKGESRSPVIVYLHGHGNVLSWEDQNKVATATWKKTKRTDGCNEQFFRESGSILVHVSTQKRLAIFG